MNVSKEEFVHKILAMQDARRDEKAEAEAAPALTETQKEYLAIKEYAAYAKQRQIQIYRRNRR